MKKLFNVSNHVLTTEQVKDSINSLGVSKIIELPEEIKKEFANVTPGNLEKIAKNIINFVFEEKDSEDIIIHLAGQQALITLLVNYFTKMNIKTVYSFTKRVSTEKIDENGIVTKTLIFRHEGWYSYITELN